MLNKAFIELFGDVNSFSPGTGMIMADRQIKRALERDEISIDEIGNAKAVARLRNGKWFMLFGGWDYDENHTAMLGAALGDVAGSVYEWHNIKRKIGKDELIRSDSFFTDDTVIRHTDTYFFSITENLWQAGSSVQDESESTGQVAFHQFERIVIYLCIFADTT